MLRTGAVPTFAGGAAGGFGNAEGGRVGCAA
jgi:hypothetical protein